MRGKYILEDSYVIEFYFDKNGKNPVEDFLSSLLDKDKISWRKVVKTMEIFSSEGLSLSTQYIKKLKPYEIWELRAEKHIRIFFVPLENKKILLLHAIKKNKRETPKVEIEKAKKRYLEYKERLRGFKQ